MRKFKLSIPPVFDFGLALLVFIFTFTGQMAVFSLGQADYARDHYLFLMSAFFHALFFAIFSGDIVSRISLLNKKALRTLTGTFLLLVPFWYVLDWGTAKFFHMRALEGGLLFINSYKWEVLTFSPHVFVPLLGVLVIVGFGIGSAFAFYSLTIKINRVWSFPMGLKKSGWVVAVAGVLLVGQQFLALHFFSGRAVATQLTVPFSVVAFLPYEKKMGIGHYEDVTFPSRPARELEETKAETLKNVSIPNGKNVFVFIIDSLRNDAVSSETTPVISALKNEGTPPAHTIASSNCTHLSWYSLMNSTPSIYWKTQSDENRGSMLVRLFKKLGYKTHLYSSVDMEAFNMRTGIFGKGAEYLDEMYGVEEMKARVPGPEVGLKDQLITDRANALIRSPEMTGNHLFVIAINSTHWDYQWASTFIPPLRPFSMDASVYSTFIKDTPEKKRLLVNRYRNSVSFADHLVGTTIAALKEKHLYENATIVVLGDHGEEFGEHGHMAHASELNAYQLETPIVIRVPKDQQPRLQLQRKLITHTDVLPTVLDGLGVREQTKELTLGQSWFEPEKVNYVLSSDASYETPDRFQISDGVHTMKIVADGLSGDSTLRAYHLRIMNWESVAQREPASHIEPQIWGREALQNLGITSFVK